ncbi:uncharacterized protein F4812DRAFT_293617 [Daldinia caldariorum]|uniref:uncharacterized protein n=1 Tax=Daldinia caldariorum TaxID=326644 RepID=UPI002007AFA1|nr:uncharacterized protein F4812DRAFT_293617 [Daldinia caldariorum]KAI1462927.1 hypothetical protein F4812DRAFT_293617 [Daldinia caldariorum]
MVGRVCRFWQQGFCRNGTACRFEHPDANANSNTNASSSSFGGPNPNANRFRVLGSGGNRDQENPYKISTDIIRQDLGPEKPSWLLSCYGPGRDAPEQLFGGHPREQSPEEVMLYIRGSSNQQQAMSEIAALVQQAEQQNQTALSNLDGALKFILSAENTHPNRIDICRQSNPQGTTSGIFAKDTAPGPQTGFSNPLVSNSFSSAPQSNIQSNPFGGGTPSFGQPSALGPKPNPFGAAPSTQAFGQPSTLGAPKPVFGQSSQMGLGGPAFGQPSALGQKPNPFASNAPGPSGFGQTAQSAFGQPSALGQKPNPFGAPAASSAPNPFSSAAPTSGPNPFGQQPTVNPFLQTVNAPSSDQQMDTSAPTPALSNPFNQPQSNSAFAPPTTNPFASQQPSSFATPSSNPFAQTQTQTQLQQQPSQPQPQTQAQAQGTPATSTSTNPYGPNSTKQHPSPGNYISKAANGRIISFNGQPVIYKWKVDEKYQDAMPQDGGTYQPAPGVQNSDGSWRKIFFPHGPPGYNKDTEPDLAMYTPTVKAAYAAVAATGRFEGDMPEVPPLREDCVWNF